MCISLLLIANDWSVVVSLVKLWLYWMCLCYSCMSE